MPPQASPLNADHPAAPSHKPAFDQLTFIWSVVGILGLLVQAQLRLGKIAWEALSSGRLTRAELSVTLFWIVLNAYLEGYRGFHRRFVPRVIARAQHLATQPRSFPRWLGPVYAMAYVRATPRAKYAAWGVTGAVLIAIFLVRRLNQPWRGIIDVGVVVGLFLGSVSLLLAAAQCLRGKVPTADPALPLDCAQPKLG